MTRLALVLTVLAARTTDPAPSTLAPTLILEADPSSLAVIVAFNGDGVVTVDADVSVRGHTTHAKRGGDRGFEAVFDLDHALEAGEPVIVTIDGGELSIPSPPAFTGIEVPQFISRSQPTTITWTATSADTIYWSTDTSACTRGGGLVAPNATSVTFMPSDWHDPTPPADRATCTTTVQFTRERTAPIETVFEAGTIQFDQSRDVVFASTP